MKTMTCKDMGGPCGMKISAGTADEMIKKGSEHVMTMKDEAHLKIANDMRNMTPEDNEKWRKEFMTKWDATPED